MYIFLTLALVLTIFAFWLRKMVLGFGAVAGWLLVSAYAFNLSTGTWDVYYSLGWFSIGLVIAMALETMALREKKVIEPELDDLDEYIKEQEDYDRKDARFRRAIMPTRARRRRLARSRKAERAASDDFANTGRIR